MENMDKKLQELIKNNFLECNERLIQLQNRIELANKLSAIIKENKIDLSIEEYGFESFVVLHRQMKELEAEWAQKDKLYKIALKG